MIIAENIENTIVKGDWLHPLNFKYLHGELEDINGFDICYSEDKEEAEVLNNKEGIYDVLVTVEKDNPDSNSKIKKIHTTYECKAYIWPLGRGAELTHGLIVLKSNKEDNDFALEKYKEKSIII